MNYDNPDSHWVAGFGRMYLPWAVSLDTIDGGYVGRRLGRGATVGVFGVRHPIQRPGATIRTAERWNVR